jgi:RNA polymerase sigma factor (sigma-70 family)
MTTPEELGRMIDAHAAALELFASQWPCSPADVVQEAFVEYAGLFESPLNAQAWLFRVVRNRAISEFRSTSRRKRRESEAGAAHSRRRQPESLSATADSRDASEVLEQLPDELREVVVARLWGGLTFEQIAEMNGTSTSTAFRRYEDALSLLRTKMGLPCQNNKTISGC